MPRGLIFDCDGVLVDSEPLAAAELATVMRGLGAPVDQARVYDDYLGRSVRYIVDAASRELAIDLAPAMPGYAESLASRFQRELQPIPGMAGALAQLAGPKAVASSSTPERLALSLGITGLAPFFGEHVYSATMVQNGKPAPDLFLLAAARLGLAAEDCVVIEDSPAGIMAAKAAGMRVVGFLGGSHAAPARLAQRLVELKPDALIEHADVLPNTLAELA
ncbi:HAD family hydrolase [Paracoccus laeviglucosivorans]|uniref:Haloacid dehalogenase superfamily, subfamily IA, variant 3 with third motif having DD or ED n=1 Tax=Paracoccus laeviglucosivorans TaxID=1197861 RepID=A0A521EIL9_9RHOB|nr:HAD-IA family hydrolase [Paracoccus laeviglucosivorans]SMO83777.1 haloacid dehalogenase superfamily, subfamily IA, variant 3 with third motif having DD or ED [Paracoccus laeviglucosivorans]